MKTSFSLLLHCSHFSNPSVNKWSKKMRYSSLLDKNKFKETERDWERERNVYLYQREQEEEELSLSLFIWWWWWWCGGEREREEREKWREKISEKSGLLKKQEVKEKNSGVSKSSTVRVGLAKKNKKLVSTRIYSYLRKTVSLSLSNNNSRKDDGFIITLSQKSTIPGVLTLLLSSDVIVWRNFSRDAYKWDRG